MVVSDIGEGGRKCVFLSCSIGRCQGVRLPQKQFAFPPPENGIGIYLKCERNTPYIFICEFATSPFYGASLFWDGERERERERAIKPFHATPTAEQDVSAYFSRVTEPRARFCKLLSSRVFAKKRRIRSGERAKSNYSSLLLPPLLGGGGKPAGLVETTFDSGNTKSACVCKTGGAASCHFPPKKKIQTKSSKFSNAPPFFLFAHTHEEGKRLSPFVFPRRLFQMRCGDDFIYLSLSSPLRRLPYT